MRPKCTIVTLIDFGLVLTLMTPVCAAPVGPEPGETWVVNLPVLFLNSVRATHINLETWYAFEWSGFVALDGWLPATGSSYYVWAGLPNPGVSPWTFTAPSEGMYFTVTDMETDADSFAIKDHGALVGTTSDTGPWDSHEPCNWDPRKCMESDFSHGTFFFGAGEHMITIENKDHRGVTGRGAFRLDAFIDHGDGSDD